MSGFLQRANETPVAMVVAIAYVTAFALGARADSEAARWLEQGVMVAALVADGEPWRLLTHAFLHGGLLHLAFNLLALVWIGPPLERALGSVRFLLLYLLAAAAGAIAVSLVESPLQSVVGGSGALFGMMGAAVAMHMQAGRHLLEFLDYHGPRQLLMLIAVNLVFGFTMPRVSNAAHIGGLLGGFLLTLGGLHAGRWLPPRSLRAALLVAGLGLGLHCLWPVARWDYNLLAWEQTRDQGRRTELRQAVSLLLTGDQGRIASDAEMQFQVDALQHLLAEYRGG